MVLRRCSEGADTSAACIHDSGGDGSDAVDDNRVVLAAVIIMIGVASGKISWVGTLVMIAELPF